MKFITTAFAACLLLILSTLNISAQEKNNFTGALLWKVSGNGLEKPSYILGTHHMMVTNFTDSIPGLNDAIEKTEQTVGELLLQDEAALQASIQQAALMPAGVTYKQLLSEEDYKKLDNGLKDLFTVGIDQFGQMKPGMISAIYTITLYTKLYPDFDLINNEGIDKFVQRIATENGKSVLGLETVEDQIYALLDSAPLKDQAEALACAVSQGESTKKSLDQLNLFYKKGDLMEMYNLAFNNPDDECNQFNIQSDALNKDRNEKWIVKLPEIMKNKPSLIAVGALHLANEEGLLYQLSKLGYKVEPVRD